MGWYYISVRCAQCGGKAGERDLLKTVAAPVLCRQCSETENQTSRLLGRNVICLLGFLRLVEMVPRGRTECCLQACWWCGDACAFDRGHKGRCSCEE